MAQLPVDNLTCQLCGGGGDNSNQLPDLVLVTRLTSYLSHQNVLEGLLVDIPSQLTDENAPKLWFKLSTCSNDLTEDSEHFLLCDNCSSELQIVDNLTNELKSIQKRIESQVLKINEIRQGSSTLTVSPGQVTISGWTSGQDNIWRGWEALGSILEGTLPRLAVSGSGVENGGEFSTETVLEETGNQSQEPEQQEVSMVCEVDEDYMSEFKIDSNVSNPTVKNCQGHSSTGKDNNEASSSPPAEVVHVTTPENEELHSSVITSTSQENVDEASSSSKCRSKRINSGPAPLSVKCKRTKVAERKFARKNLNLIQLVQKRALTVKLERLSLPSSTAGPRKFDYFYARGKESRDYRCPHCGEILKGHCNLGAHLFQQHLDRRPHVCDICNWPFTTRNTLRGHKRVHSDERRYKCKLCTASFKWSFCFKKHLKSCKNKSQHKKIGNYKAIFNCQHCDRTFKKKADLKRHYLKEHSDLRPYSCQICNWPFATEQYLEIHQWVHNKETPGFKPPVILKEHPAPMQTSINKSAKKPKLINKTAKCQYCDFTAEAKDKEQHWQLLSPHYREKHLDKRQFLCQVCPRTFLKRKQLKEHQLKHSALKNNELKVKLCELCDKTFAQSSYLNRHINSVHLNSKPLECVFCLSTFARKDKFDLHLMGHIGEKPFSCDLCASAFKEERILRIHKQTHAWVKPFKCLICLRSYVSKDGLKNHVCRGN